MSEVSKVSYPFRPEHIERVTIYGWMKSGRWDGEIKFRAGDTSGDQSFEVKADTGGFEALVRQMRQFLENLGSEDMSPEVYKAESTKSSEHEPDNTTF